MPKPRAKTNAERQAAYRLRHVHDLEASGERLSMVVSVQAKCQLKRLARHKDDTQRATLERLLVDAEREALEGMKSEDHAAYYDGDDTQ
jgi:hypothetical protein